MATVELDGLEQISLKEISKEDKLILLKELGFNSDGTYVINEEGEQINDKYIGIPVRVENMLIFPGSTIILDNNEISIALYLQEYGDVS